MSEKKPIVEKVREPIVYVGNKPLMRYVNAGLAILAKGEPIVEITGRGKQIYRVVGVAEILKRRGIKVKHIYIGTESFKDQKGIKRNKSYIVISMMGKAK